MTSENEELISLREASKMTPYSSEYLSLLVRKGKLDGEKKDGKWFTKKTTIENYLKKVAEASYQHQENLNVKVPAAEIKKASLSLKWALALAAVIILGGLTILGIMTFSKKNNSGTKFEVVEDKDNNLIIYVDDPTKIGKVTVMPKE